MACSTGPSAQAWKASLAGQWRLVFKGTRTPVSIVFQNMDTA
jgi:hypothetical protein